MAGKIVRSGFRCYHCGSLETCKAGFSKFGSQKKQRFFCRDCRRLFREKPEYIEGTRRKGNFWVRKNLPSAGHLILELKAIAQHVLGRTPTTRDINELSKQGRINSLNTYYAVFGTFREALRRARLTPTYPRPYDPEQMLGELRRLRRKLSRPVLKRDVVAAWKKGNGSSIYFFRRAFGTFEKALEKAGAGPKRYSRAEMIDSLRKLYTKLGRPVNKADVEKFARSGNGPYAGAIVKEFDGFLEACRIAKVRTDYAKYIRQTRNRRYSQEELIQQLKALAKRLGRRPTSRDISQASTQERCVSAKSFAKAFGSLNEAYRRAGFEGVRPHSYTDKEIVAAVKMLKKELGRFPYESDLAAASKAGKCPSPTTVKTRLGNLTELRERM